MTPDLRRICYTLDHIYIRAAQKRRTSNHFIPSYLAYTLIITNASGFSLSFSGALGVMASAVAVTSASEVDARFSAKVLLSSAVAGSGA